MYVHVYILSGLHVLTTVLYGCGLTTCIKVISDLFYLIKNYVIRASLAEYPQSVNDMKWLAKIITQYHHHIISSRSASAARYSGKTDRQTDGWTD